MIDPLPEDFSMTSHMSLSHKEIIEHLKLEPLPLEGGYYRRTFASEESLDLGKGYSQPLATGIYFLLTRETFSALR